MWYTSNEQILTSDYLDILYQGHNKNYGGYELRKNYERRVLSAVTLLILLAGFISGYSLLTADHSRMVAPKDRPIVLAGMHPVIIQPPVVPHPPVTPVHHKAAAQNTTPPIITTEPIAPKDAPVRNADITAPGATNTPGDITTPATGTTTGKETGTEAPTAPKPPVEIHRYADLMPAPGYGISDYLSNHLRYPEMAREAGLQGKVVIQFVVNEDGRISDAKVIKGIGAACDAEALRVVAAMPKWRPGSQNGVPVKVYYTLPIVFELD